MNTFNIVFVGKKRRKKEKTLQKKIEEVDTTQCCRIETVSEQA